MISFAALALLAFQGTSVPPKPSSDAVVATIDGKPVTAAEIEPYLWAWKTREVVTQLAYYRATDAEAAKKGVSVTDAEVKARMDDQITKLKASLPAGQTVEDFLQSKGLNLTQISLALRNGLLIEKIADKEFDPDSLAKLSIILFRSQDDKPNAPTAAKNASTAYAALQAGKPWNTVEKTYEKEPRLLQANGSIGWTAVAALPEGAKSQITSLKPMGYTTPITTPAGLAIFRLDTRGKDAPATELAPAKEKSIEAARQAVTARIRAASKVEFKG